MYIKTYPEQSLVFPSATIMIINHQGNENDGDYFYNENKIWQMLCVVCVVVVHSTQKMEDFYLCA